MCLTCADGRQEGGAPECKPCDDKCSLCKLNAVTLAEECISCKPGVFRSGTTGCKICPSSQYLSTGGVCTACGMATCQKCLTASTCMVCDSGYATGQVTLMQDASTPMSTMSCVKIQSNNLSQKLAIQALLLLVSFAALLFL